MEFSRQEYWSGLPFPSHRGYRNLDLLHFRQILYRLSHLTNSKTFQTRVGLGLLSLQVVSGQKVYFEVFLGNTPLVAQRLKHLSPMWETRVRPLGWEDHLEKEMITHSSILAWRIHGRRSLVGYSPRGLNESDTTERLHFHFRKAKGKLPTLGLQEMTQLIQ